jgi:hypothetical protein
MGWSERHAFFERIVEMRDRYAVGHDRAGVLSIADAILYVEAVMTAVELDVEPWLADPDEAVPDGVPVEPRNDGANGGDASTGPAGRARRTGPISRRRLLGDLDSD